MIKINSKCLSTGTRLSKIYFFMDTTSKARQVRNTIYISLIFCTSYDTLGNNITGLIATCVGFFSFSVISEAIKRTRVHVIEKTIHQTRRNVEDTITNDVLDDQHAEEEDLLVRTPDHAPDEQRWSTKTKLKVLDGILFSIQMISSYILMLVVMTFSGWLFIAIVLGQSIGQSIFFYRPSIHQISSYPQSTSTSRDQDLNITSPSTQENQAEEGEQILDESNDAANVISVEVY